MANNAIVNSVTSRPKIALKVFVHNSLTDVIHVPTLPWKSIDAALLHPALAFEADPNSFMKWTGLLEEEKATTTLYQSTKNYLFTYGQFKHLF